VNVLYTVYCIKNIYSNKFYVGSTKNVVRRKSRHFGTLRKGVHRNRRLQKDYFRYGEGAFEFIVLCKTSTKEKALKFEQMFIDGFEQTYNILPKAGSAEGREYTNKTLMKMSETAKGRIITEEQKAKLRVLNLGRKIPEEVRKRMSEAQRKLIVEGKRKFASKLTENDVFDILKRLDNGESRDMIAKHYNVSKSCIAHIAQGTTWSRVIEKYRKNKEEFA
jgi:group I intron endonuclease